jgi:hypothetical protein
MKILLRDFNAKIRRSDIFKPMIGNESLHEIRSDNWVRVVHFATSRNLIVKIVMFSSCNSHEYTWTSHDRKKHNQTDHILNVRRKHSNTVDVQSLRGADCDSDHYLMVAKVRQRL